MKLRHVPISSVSTAFFIVALLVSTSVLADSSYTITDLGNLGPYSPNAINDSGQVVGQMIDNDSEHVGFLWENGAITILKTADETLYEPHAIDDLGLVAGQGRNYVNESLGQAYIWENGQMTNLGDIGGATHDARGINDFRQIVGGTTGALNHFFIWENGQMTDLGEGFAYGINNSVQIVGRQEISNEDYGFLWENGNKTYLGPGAAWAINDSGQVVGTSGGSAFLWENGRKTILGTGGAHGINNSGLIVGSSGGNAVLWRNGTMTDLNSLIPIDSGWHLDSATDINEIGQIVGKGIFNGENHGFLLTPQWGAAYSTLFNPISNQLELMRTYRDDVLSKTARGRRYKKLLYRRSQEALKVLLENPELMAEAKDLIYVNILAVDDVIHGQEGITYNTDEIAAFLDAYANEAPFRLRLLAKMVKWQMLQNQRKGKLFFGFRLE